MQKTTGRVDLAKVIVNEYSGTLIPLANPKSYHVRVCGQKDTVYAGNEDQLEAWEDHYLSERMTMTVIGAIDDFPCEAFARQLVLLLCEDGNIYAYEDEVVHLVAESLKDLLENGMTFPGSKSYNLGECFEEYTEEEYEELMECSEMKKMREEHEKFRESLGRELLECLEDLQKRQFKILPDGERSGETCRTSQQHFTQNRMFGDRFSSMFFTGPNDDPCSPMRHTFHHNNQNCKVSCAGVFFWNWGLQTK